jgi:RNA polymerase sigma factor (sigma-70 family)
MPASAEQLLTTFLHALERGVGAAVTDGQLLQRFLAHRDEEAFAALVQRHGPMVLGVCRRILDNTADAEDAFQATFVVLVRKAASLVHRAVLGDWLHGVARHTALKARTEMVRRRTRERIVARSEVPRQPPRNDWLPLLDQEINRLPEKYRLPVVLCDLESHTRTEAAARLGWPEGTVAARLARGRALLGKRLIRGAVVLSGALPLANASELVTPALAATTIGSAVRGPTSPAVAVLSEGVLRAMSTTRLKFVTAALLVAAVVGIGVVAQTPQPVPVEEKISTRAPLPVAPRLWAGISVTQPVFESKNTTINGIFQINFTVVNDGDKTIDPDIGSSELLVNGKPMKDWDFIIHNGPRDDRWTALPPGDCLEFGYGLGDRFEKPGIYRVQWKGKNFQSAEIVFRVLPRKNAPAAPPPPDDGMTLQQHLLELDAMRAGRSTRFDSVETRGKELLARYRKPDEQAKIYFMLAHVYGQSGIDQHPERVMRYARLALPNERDEKQRAQLYIYLGCAAEVDPTLLTFEEKRRRAAAEYLEGYREMLVLKLPDIAPELPGVNKLGDVERPTQEELDRHAAQMKAREEAARLRALVEVRDILIRQIVALYQREPAADAELRQAATRILGNPKAADDLMARQAKR